MGKALLSLVVLVASGAYVWSQYSEARTGEASLDGASATDQILSDAITAPEKIVLAPMQEESIDLKPVSAPSNNQTTATISVDQTATGSTRSAVIAPPTFQPMPPAPAREAASAPKPQLDAVSAAPKFGAPLPGVYRDGIYRGTAANAYYGIVQLQAIIKGGKLVSVKVLQYPNDRNTSRYINAHALPVLQREAIRAQSAKVDVVSGATLTSDAYAKSLASALTQGRSHQAG